jgi:hypothetical protein
MLVQGRTISWDPLEQTVISTALGAKVKNENPIGSPKMLVMTPSGIEDEITDGTSGKHGEVQAVKHSLRKGDYPVLASWQ